MIKLRHDSRDKIFSQRFGQVIALSDFPDEIDFDTNFPDEIQPTGDVKCVAYSTCDIAEDQQNLEFDLTSIDDLWDRVPKFPNGSDPRDVLKEAVKNGLKPKGGERIKRWASFWRPDLGIKDSFDNIRSTMMLIKGSVLIATDWYKEWHTEILPIGKNPQGGHAYVAYGWKTIDNEPYLKIQAWTGRTYLMPRNTLNNALTAWGTQAWVLSTTEIDSKREKGLVEAIKDLCINFILLLKKMIRDKGVDPVVIPEMPEVPIVPVELEPVGSKLILWATAIRDYEGKPGDLNYKNNNPGNIKAKSGGFLKFKTYQEGFNYLLDYLTRAATGKHPGYRPDFTLLRFFQTYAPSTDKNNPKLYAAWVAKRIGVEVNTPIKNLV
jgi:hypothetical protein